MTTTSETNVYQDGKWLVVPLVGAVFPNRCVKTNAGVIANYVFEEDLMPDLHQLSKSDREHSVISTATLLAGKAGRAIGDFMVRRRLKYYIGLSPERQTIARTQKRIGLALVIIGPLLAILLAMGISILTEKMLGRISFPLMFTGFGIGMILMIIGIVLFGIASMATLRVIRSDGKYVWLEGAGSEFLATLPPSPESWKPRRLFG